MKVVIFELEDWEKVYLAERLKGHELLFFNEELEDVKNPDIYDADLISVFIYSDISAKMLKRFTQLKGIITRSTGFDHIDVKYCKKHAIRVLNVPHYGANTVAEHTFGLILSLSRKIHTSYVQTTRGNFSLDNLRGFDLKGKTLGIIGLGNIGRHVARIAKGFEMQVITCDTKKNKHHEKTHNVAYTTLAHLLKTSDIITIHCPLNKATHHLINQKNIATMKKSALIINTARGGIIETQALVKALANKTIGGAGLDVLEEEEIIREEIELMSKNYPKEKLQKLVQNHLLLTFDNVIITPHNAFNSTEALQRILDTTIENIQCFTSKKKRCNDVSL